MEPENATPGIALTAPGCAGLHRGRSPQGAGGVYQSCAPSVMRKANIPPPTFGSASVPHANGTGMRLRSETAT